VPLYRIFWLWHRDSPFLHKHRITGNFPKKDIILVVVYEFGNNPMLLLTNLAVQKTKDKKKIYLIVTKVYMMRWRTEEYFKFKN